MKTYAKCCVAVVFVLLTCVVPSLTSAAEGTYAVLKGGIYSPQTNDLDGFDTGFGYASNFV
jgi:hypothetical protein